MKNILIIVSVLVFLVTFISGCEAPPPPPITSGIGAESVTNEIPPATYLKVDNPELAEKLTISDVKHRYSKNLLEVNVELSSQFDETLKLQYHFNWFDADGFVIESRKSPWIPLNLHGHQSTTLRGVAPNSKVQSFNVYVRTVPENSYEY